jgi:hypothetical protein
MGNDLNRYFQRKSQIFELAPASGAAYVVNAANLAAGRRAVKSKEMKMTVPSAQKIIITQSANEPREIDNLVVIVTFQINGQTYFDYEDQGTFNNCQTDGLTGVPIRLEQGRHRLREGRRRAGGR